MSAQLLAEKRRYEQLRNICVAISVASWVALIVTPGGVIDGSLSYIVAVGALGPVLPALGLHALTRPEKSPWD